MNSIILGKIIFQKIPNLIIKEIYRDNIVFGIKNFDIDFYLKNSYLFRGEIKFYENLWFRYKFNEFFTYLGLNDIIESLSS